MIKSRHRTWGLACLALCVLLPVARADDPRSAQHTPEERSDVRAKVPKAPHIDTLLSETHPAVPERAFFVESVVRVIGKGFGRTQEGGRLELRVASLPEPRSVEVLSWRDDEVRVRLPRAAELGIDPATAEVLRSELSGERRFVAITAQLSLLRDDHVAKLESPVQVVVVAKDFDGDGKPRESDANDFDPKVQ